MVDERIIIEVSDEELDSAIAKADQALEGARDVDDAVQDILKDEASLPTLGELEGVEYAQRRIISMIPGVREAYALARQVQTLLGIAPELSILIGVALLIREVVDMVRRQEERTRELEILVRQAGGFKTLGEAREWMTEQTRLARQAYQGGSP